MNNCIHQIEQVLYRVCHAVDQGQINNFVNLFHPDGRFIITWEENGKYTGHEEIQNWITNYDNVLRSSMKYLRHKITCPMIEVSGDSATAYSYLDVEAAPKDNNKVTITVGHYEDQLVRVGDNWLLKEKIVFMDNMYSI